MILAILIVHVWVPSRADAGSGTRRVIARAVPLALQDSSKGGAVETGRSDLYDVIY